MWARGQSPVLAQASKRGSGIDRIRVTATNPIGRRLKRPFGNSPGPVPGSAALELDCGDHVDLHVDALAELQPGNCCPSR